MSGTAIPYDGSNPDHVFFLSCFHLSRFLLIQHLTMRKSRRLPPELEDGRSLSESGYSFHLMKVAISQICQSAGFKGAQNAALEVITDISTRYLKAVAKSASISANAQGRTQSNLTDTIVALEDLASVQGFDSASRVTSSSLFNSGVVTNLMTFVEYTNEIPFAQRLPPRKTCSRSDYFVGGRDCYEVSSRHVPKWLPAFPVVALGEDEKERKRDGRWGSCDGGAEREDDGRWAGEKKNVAVKWPGNKQTQIELPEKRRKVGFKIGREVGIVDGGVNLRHNRVCSSSSLSFGIGKRVILCNNWNDD